MIEIFLFFRTEKYQWALKFLIFWKKLEDPQAVKSCDVILIEDFNSHKQLQRKTLKINILELLKDLWKDLPNTT